MNWQVSRNSGRNKVSILSESRQDIHALIGIVRRASAKKGRLMRRNPLSFSVKTLVLAIGLSIVSSLCTAATIPASTAIPVRFTHTVDAAKAKSGDVVKAQTLQPIVLPDGSSLARGTLVIGHVVEVHPYVEDRTPYGKSSLSVLAIHFDRAVDKTVSIPLNVSMRALADRVASDKASSPVYGLDDNVGTMQLVGGDHYTPGSRVGFSPDHSAVLSIQKDGVYAHLIANDYVHGDVVFHCDGTSTQQPVGIFSANACGYFGYDAIYLEANGSIDSGTFRLDSGRDTVKIYAGSTALLETH